MIRVSYVIPAYDEEHYIRRCLDAILRDTAGRDDCEIIVADNNSNDDTCAIVARDYPAVRLVREPRRGANRARETGFTASQGALVAFLDADTEIPRGWTARAERAFAEDPNLVCVSGPFIYYDLPAGIRILVRMFYGMSYLVYLMNNFVTRRTSVIQGGTEIVRRDALQKIGGHDVTLTFYGDDADLARRLSRVGEVRFSFAFAVRSSGRRLAKEGAFTMGVRYAMNYFWITLFNRPFTHTSTEVRFTGDTAAYRPERRAKEWANALLFFVVTLILLAVAAAILGGIIYALSRLRI